MMAPTAHHLGGWKEGTTRDQLVNEAVRFLDGFNLKAELLRP